MLLLFDIDGTLLLTDRAGARAMQEAGQEVLGPRFTLQGVSFAGRLDPLIWADGAATAGVDAAADGLHGRFRAAYARILSRRLAAEPTARALPGVRALLERLGASRRHVLGLLTGNYEETGRIKLVAAGIDPDLFRIAAWGTDGRTRRELPPVAIARCEAATGRTLAPRHVVVVGDTHHDVDCARANGCLAVAVASGPACTLEDLRAHGPDLLLPDLADADAFLAWLDAREDPEPPLAPAAPADRPSSPPLPGPLTPGAGRASPTPWRS